MIKKNRRILATAGVEALVLFCLTMLSMEAFATPEVQVKNAEQQISLSSISEPNIKETSENAAEIDVLTADIVDYAVNIAETVQVNETNDRMSIINTKVDSFVTTKKLKQSDVVVVKPIYDNDGKLFIESPSESMCLDIRTISNWTEDDFYAILNEEMYDLVPIALRLEDEVGINALYTIAVGANETGWGKHMAGDFNYSNWTNDAIDHFNFETLGEFEDFTVETYNGFYINEEFYEEKLGFIPEHITLEVVNVKYALNSDDTTNWQWSNVVAEIMSNLCARKSA